MGLGLGTDDMPFSKLIYFYFFSFFFSLCLSTSLACMSSSSGFGAWHEGAQGQTGPDPDLNASISFCAAVGLAVGCS